jgi:GNAT superfamily N-acetyltransferase
VELRAVGFDHPDAQTLTEQVQQEYVVRYGGIDRSPIDPREFGPPGGLFLVAYLDGRPVGCAGWRTPPYPLLRPGDAEVKRMYVAPEARRRGLARRLLACLERDATAAGKTRMVLETGLAQPEAITLYLSAGYAPILSFGLHRDSPGNRCYARSLTAAAADVAPEQVGEAGQ